MDLSQIRELLNVVAESNVEELTVEEEGLKITVRKSTPTVTMQPSGSSYPMPAPAYPPYGASYGGGYPPNAQQPPVQAQGAPPGAQARPGEAGGTAASTQEEPAGAASQTAPPDGEAAPAKRGTVVPAPIVGTFYRRPSPDDDPYVEVGDTVEEGDVLCLIEAMKLMNEIECETPGTIKEILVEDAEPVEYEQPLFVIEEA